MQVAASRVVAKPGPDAKDVIEVRRSKRPNRGPTRQEARVVRTDCFHRCLLKHDFGQPDVIRFRTFATSGSPGRKRACRSYQASGLGRIRRLDFLPRRQSDSLTVMMPTMARHAPTSKPAIFPATSPELLSVTLGDALKAQGFASTEIISRWRALSAPRLLPQRTAQDQLASSPRP